MPSAHPDRRKLYVRIADELREDLAAGRFPVGEPFPPIGELAERFRSAKATIERAVEVLRGEGLLESRQGSRTVVIAVPDSSTGTHDGSEERSEEFQIIFGQLQEMRSAIGHLRAKIEELDERTKGL
ncbi:winged helix-turn-helix domain-containing protein [Actinoallomurus sp. CA-150999]|uniref:winged helix-turn-helix domain-containing protein n=1 Tax=Actinoallomurus sp. CA-150999 TaxID=3239887 RepID=UPI003D933E52